MIGEQGITFSLTLFINILGVGCKQTDTEWTKHYDEFENILQSLNQESANNSDNSAFNSHANSGDESDSNKAGSLERRSKSSKSRVQ